MQNGARDRNLQVSAESFARLSQQVRGSLRLANLDFLGTYHQALPFVGSHQVAAIDRQKRRLFADVFDHATAAINFDS